jgi:outer membrane protein assembly factor BamB
MTSVAGPATWPERLKLKWKLTVGEGHASPILAGGRIFIFTRQQGKETASSIDPTTGKIVWHQSYAAPYTMTPAAAWHGEGPKSTPLFNEGKLYTFGISGILTCWDAATGALKWRKNFSKQYKATWRVRNRHVAGGSRFPLSRMGRDRQWRANGLRCPDWS